MKTLTLILLLFASAASAAQTQPQSVVVEMKPGQLRPVIHLTVYCDMTPGTKIATFTSNTGVPMTWAITGTTTTSLAWSGNDLVIGPTGVAPADCNASVPFTVNGQ